MGFDEGGMIFSLVIAAIGSGRIDHIQKMTIAVRAIAYRNARAQQT